jgi:hypothetical protein
MTTFQAMSQAIPRQRERNPRGRPLLRPRQQLGERGGDPGGVAGHLLPGEALDRVAGSLELGVASAGGSGERGFDGCPVGSFAPERLLERAVQVVARDDLGEVEQRAGGLRDRDAAVDGDVGGVDLASMGCDPVLLPSARAAHRHLDAWTPPRPELPRHRRVGTCRDLVSLG